MHAHHRVENLVHATVPEDLACGHFDIPLDLGFHEAVFLGGVLDLVACGRSGLIILFVIGTVDVLCREEIILLELGLGFFLLSVVSVIVDVRNTASLGSMLEDEVIVDVAAVILICSQFLIA